MDLIRACKYGDAEACREILSLSDFKLNLEDGSLSPLHWLLLGLNNSDDVCTSIISTLNGLGSNHAANDVVLSGSNVLEKVSSVTPLHLSVLYKGPSVTRKLLAMHSNPDIADSNGDTPLMYACRQNDSEKVDALLLYGASAHSINRLGESAYTVSTDLKIRDMVVSRLNQQLVKAARKSTGLVTVELLLKARADVNASDKLGRCALALSLAAGNTNALLSLLEYDQIDASKIDSVDGLSVIHELVLSSIPSAEKAEVVHELIFRKADVNSKNRVGKTPLDLCFACGELDLAKVLQENGAEVTKSQVPSQPQIDGEISPSAISEEPRSPPNQSAIPVNLSEIAGRVGSLYAELTSARASVDGIETYNSTYSLPPAASKTTSMVTEAELVAQKVELLNKLNMYLSEFERVKGNRSKDFKSIGLFMELQKMISDSREEINSVNQRLEMKDFVVERIEPAPAVGTKSSSWFRSPDSIEADVEFLIRIIRKSTGLAVEGVEGSILAILKACQTSQVIPVLKLLRNRGADVNFREKDSGCSCLMLAAGGDSEELVDWLLANAADPCCVQKATGMNALHIASLRGNKRICQLIIDKTSKTSNALSILNARDKQGRTPLDICNNPSVARILEPAASA